MLEVAGGAVAGPSGVGGAGGTSSGGVGAPPQQSIAALVAAKGKAQA